MSWIIQITHTNDATDSLSNRAVIEDQMVEQAHCDLRFVAFENLVNALDAKLKELNA